MTAIREALQELEDVLNCEGFGCACTPMGKCATCKARDVLSGAWPAFRKLRAALSQEVPQDGWKMVPVKPTQAMIDAGWIDKEDTNPDEIYAAMLAAAPQVKVAAAPSGELPPPEWDLQLSRVLHEMAGAVSLCWEPRPAGEFQSTQACEFVAAAIAELRSYAKAARGASLTDEKIRELGKGAFGIDIALDGNLMKFARAIEAARSEK